MPKGPRMSPELIQGMALDHKCTALSDARGPTLLLPASESEMGRDPGIASAAICVEKGRVVSHENGQLLVAI